MKLLIHLLRWDVRRFRLLLCVWLVVIAAGATLKGVWPVLAADRATRGLAGTVGSLLSLTEVLFSIVLVALVVQAHPLVGSNAFWMTRPVPSRWLLAAKLVLVGVFMIAAPVMADAILMVVYQVPPAQIAGVSAQTAIFWSLWIVIMMTVAALTPNVAKLALVLGGALISIVASVSVMLSVALYSVADTPPGSGGNIEPEDPTAGLVVTLLTIAAGMALLLVQYRTRMRVRSVATGVACVVMAHVVASAWAWPMLVPAAARPEWAEDPAMLSLSADDRTAHFAGDFSYPGGQPSQWRVGRAHVWMSGIAPGWTAAASVREARVQVNGQTVLTSRIPGSSAYLVVGNQLPPQQREAMRQLLDVDRLADTSPDPPSEPKAETTVLFVREPELRRLESAEGRYEGRFRVSLTRHEIEAVLPLRSGAAHRNGAYQIEIVNVQRPFGMRNQTSQSPSQQTRGVSILVRTSNAMSVFDRRQRRWFASYLRNPRTSQATPGSEHDLRDEVTLMRAMPFAIGLAGGDGGAENAGFRPRAVELTFPPGYGLQGQAFPIDDRWIEQAELVIVRSTQEATVERTLQIANFPLRAE